MLVKSVFELIGNTPLLEIDRSVHGLKNIRLYAKLEHLNPFGSLKDRAAWNILSEEVAALSAENQTVIESSSGNMAKAMTVICGMHGVPFRVVTNRIPVREVKQMLQLLGAEVSEFPGLSSCPDPTDPNNPIAQIEREMAANPGKYFHTSQFTNEKNTAAHKNRTGPEIVLDLASAGGVDYFITGMGTTGSSRGAGEHLKAVNDKLQVLGVVAKKGHVVPGIRNSDEMHEVGLFKKDFYDNILEVDTDDAIDGMLTLSRKPGVLAGPTSGASFTAALRHLKAIDATLTSQRNAVFIVCDRVEWYLSYLQKYRPELFGLSLRKDSPRSLSEEDASGAAESTVEEAKKALSEKPPLVVDLRGSLAYKAGHIAGSINIPAEQLDEICRFGVPFPAGQKVLLVCPVGDESRRFTAFLSKRGVDCSSLKGGFIAWRDAGEAVARLQPPVAAKAKEKSDGTS